MADQITEASLKLGGDWATKEGSLLGFNDQNGNYKPIPFDFTRATTATRVNRDGLIEEVQAGVPRIDFSDGEGSLLLEPQRTNNITYSEDMSNAFWSLDFLGTGVAPIVTANYATSPDGTQNASRIQFDRGAGTTTGDFSLLASSSIAPSSGDFVVTFYAKTLSGTSANLLCYLGGTTTGVGEVVTLSDEWQRFSISATASSNGSVLFGTRAGSGFYYTGGNQTLDVAIWGVQKEAGSYSTSLIPTSGSAVTRVADAAFKTGISSLIGQTEGTLFVEFEYSNNSVGVISIHSGNIGNRIYIGTGSNGLISQVRVGYVQQAFFSTPLTIGTTYKCAIAYKANDFALYVNGSQIGTDTSGSVPSSMIKFGFESGAGGDVFNQPTKQTMLYKTRLTNEELAALTTI